MSDTEINKLPQINDSTSLILLSKNDDLYLSKITLKPLNIFMVTGLDIPQFMELIDV